MAIKSLSIACNNPPKSACSTNNSLSGNVPCRVVKINFVKDGSATSTVNKSPKSKKKNSQSPYLSNDRVQLLSRVTEKRLVHKKMTDFVSSFPLAANIYKANSDELNSLRRANKKVKKSVLTLPNDPAPLPKACTVSDMNDSEYQDHKNENRKGKVKKRPLPNCKKIRVRNKDFEFYDRDARYCSQLNINLDCSSTDVINYNGDNKRLSKGKLKKTETNNYKAHDVWAVLRNINRFQFQPSPPMSGDSMAVSPKMKKIQKRRNACKDTRLIETCHTEEIAYISSYELGDKSTHSFSQSSCDRVTVIDKQDEFSQICEEIGKRILTNNDLFQNTQKVKGRNQNKYKNTNKNALKNPKPYSNCAAKDVNNNVGMNKKNLKLKSFKKLVNDRENTQKVDNSDIISCKSKPSTIALSPVPYDDKVDFIYSFNQSDSSKAALEAKPNLSKDKTSLFKLSSAEFDPQFKGISKVVLSTGLERPVSKPQDSQKDLLNKKPRRRTTTLTTTIMPKLTQTEVKRRLAHIKFPLVILGKDQVNSEIEVMDYEPPQFDGLDQHIWPFMREWNDDFQPTRCKTPPEAETKGFGFTANRKCSPNCIESNSSKYCKNSNETNTNKQPNYRARRHIMMESVKDKIKPNDKEPTPLAAIDNKLEQYKKPKPVRQLKERMLNLLYKKTSNRSIDKENQCIGGKGLSSLSFENKVHVGTDIQADSDDWIPEEITNRRYGSPDKSPIVIKKTQNNVKQRWARAKWASDFIENVIKKIKNGVYYTQDNKYSRSYTSNNNMKEMSIQTTPIAKMTSIYNQNDIHLDLSSKDVKEEHDPFKIISECDTLSAVEIKTFSRNLIAIKHCVTNVVVQFDVSIPTETQIILDPKKSSSLIPLEVTGSQTNIFKSKTTIVNAVLPAELCSILPKMMRYLIDVKTVNLELPVSLQPILFDKTNPPDSISKLAQSGSQEISKEFVSPLHTSPELQTLFVGMFPKRMINSNGCSINDKSFRKVHHKMSVISVLLPKISLQYLLPCERARLTETIPGTIWYGTTIFPRLKGHQLSERRISNALEPYIAANHSLKPTFMLYDLINIVQIMMRYKNIQIILKSIALINELKVKYDGHSVTLNMVTKNKQGLDESMTLTVNTLQLDPFFNGASENKKDIKNNDVKCIEDIHIASAKKVENKESKDHLNVVTNRGRRKGFFKLYRKCKSTTNIYCGERSSSTPINKITNLDEFFQVLGTKRWVTSVFDGYAAKKILSFLIEMKNWITDINARQALLILLLTNKKDTPNLVRFRPVLLQGIAVNRITRATELDLEIEVIERENFNKLSQFEGISYMPASVENNDKLLEELYWIAKTTASDYQRPFDDTSEKLLKSLLEKRKKLNPSYLRLMARYVGLGLLKSPVKK